MMEPPISEGYGRIHDMCEKDIEWILGMERSAFLTPWSRESFVSAVRDSRGINLVCRYEGDLVGYLTSFVILDEAFITNLFVAPSHRRRGVGAALLKVLIQRVEKMKGRHIFLEVRERNHAAITLYKKSNFQLIGVRKKYCADAKEDALVMKFSLKSE